MMVMVLFLLVFIQIDPIIYLANSEFSLSLSPEYTVVIIMTLRDCDTLILFYIISERIYVTLRVGKWVHNR